MVMRLGPGGTIESVSAPAAPRSFPPSIVAEPVTTNTIYSSAWSARDRMAPSTASLTTVTKFAARVIQCLVPSESVFCGASAKWRACVALRRVIIIVCSSLGNLGIREDLRTGSWHTNGGTFRHDRDLFSLVD